VVALGRSKRVPDWTAGNAGSGSRQAVEWFVSRTLSLLESEELTPLPTRPTELGDVPAAAWSQLERCCGDLTPERMLVIPGTRKRPSRWRRLALRTRVVAFGSRAVGQWTEDDRAGAVEFIPLEDVRAIDDRLILLYGRLSLIGQQSRIVVQYNAVARRELRESILWLRRKVAGPEFATRRNFVWIGEKGNERPEGELPHKWAYMLGYRDDLRIDPSSNEMVAVGDVTEIGRSRGPATGIAVLGPHELVVAAEPPDCLYASRYGVDLTVVPRCFLGDVGWSGGDIRIRLRDGEDAPAGPSLSRPLDERLFEAMRRSFGDAVTWT
jgi:hypothetical protein